MSISISKEAAKHISNQLQKRNHGIGIRVGIKNSGCSGFAYYLEFVDYINKDDLEFKSENISIIVDQKSFIFVDGLNLDFVKDGLNEGFQFNNPNEKNSCGCGESVSF